MSDNIVVRIRACASKSCGHDRVEHYRDAKGEGDCLAGNCTCKRFVDPDAKEEKRDTLPAPHPALFKYEFPW